MSEAQPTPALGYSFTCNIDERTNMVVQCFVGEDASDEDVNAKLDRAYGFVQRIKARGEIVELRGKLDSLRKIVAQMVEDRGNIDVAYEKQVATSHVEIEKLNATIAEITKEGEAQFLADGRRGDYAPTGARKANIERQEAAIRGVEAELAKNEAERQAAIANYEVSKTRHEQEIALVEKRIAELEALI